MFVVKVTFAELLRIRLLMSLQSSMLALEKIVAIVSLSLIKFSFLPLVIPLLVKSERDRHRFVHN